MAEKYGKFVTKLDRGRRRLAGHIKLGEGQEEALFCKRDGFLMLASLEQDDVRVSKKTLYYICPRCGDKINPKVEPVIHGAIVQTRDNAIHYQHKRNTISAIPLRSMQKKPHELDKFINDPIAGITDAPYTTITRRKIVMNGQPNFFIRVDVDQ